MTAQSLSTGIWPATYTRLFYQDQDQKQILKITTKDQDLFGLGAPRDENRGLEDYITAFDNWNN